ncbi:DsbC family protein [Oceanobacter antarcticus]|jgi:thiol:disulfide interchange protein DsbC|uniref:Thiol:disulfide interchange protein n=1 Tax=Oceanobacter antarcticus TaxID=3133425 RepID=A0ABW8NDE9_9GAMM
MKKLLLALLVVGLAACNDSDAGNSDTAATQNQAASSDNRTLAESRLQQVYGPHVSVEAATLIANGQILEVILEGGPAIYMTPDASHLIYRDELIAIDGPQAVNITQQRMNPRRAESLAAVVDSDTVLFPAKGEQKALINVFTDIDCGYCQKLHQEIPRINELGITVRYLAYPRSGIQDPQTGRPTQSFQKINYVWCQDDRKTAMSEMKNTQRELNSLSRQLRAGDAAVQTRVNELQNTLVSNMKAGAACQEPIAVQYQLGQKLGVNGTPAIIVDDGRLFPGYMPAEELARELGVL